MTIRTGLLMFLAACTWQAQGQDQAAEVPAKPSAKQMFLTRQIPYIDPDESQVAAKPKSEPAAGSNIKPKPKPKPAAAAVPDQTYSGQPAAARPVPVIRASYSGVPLGLRYTLQKTDGDHSTNVPADTEFHSGEHIQLSLEINDTGYLYVVSQGTSGRWSALFPSSEIENGDNRVERGRVYTVPPGRKAITFNDTPGEEHLFVIVSRQPVQEIDSLIFSLRGGRQTPAADHGREQPAAQVLSASARLDDSQIAKMRETYTRDLIVEDLGHAQSGQAQGGQPRDNSVYVVNPKGSADSRVVADIPLTHKK
jgi:hypothetical protein